MKQNSSKALSLIGMPGVGKSTVGVLLAKRIGYGFVDTDVLIQQRAEATLQTILARDGYRALRELEASVLLTLSLDHNVIATGGSAVYSADAMQHLLAAGPVVYLRAEIDVLLARVSDLCKRGVASPSGHSLGDVYAERTPLYARYATHTVDAGDAAPEQIADLIIAQLR